MVSHDRYLLDAVTSRTLELEDGRVESYPGAYSAYVALKAEQVRLQQEAWKRQQEEIEKLKDYIRRYKAGQRAAQAHSREKMLARVENAAVDRPRETRAMRVKADAVPASGRMVARLKNVAKRFEDNGASGGASGADDRPGGVEVLSGVSMEIYRGERIGLLGPNGAGKSTLLRLIAGLDSPTSGIVTLGAGVRPRYFAQESAEVLDPANTVLDEILADRPMTPEQVRTYLGRFLFSGEDVFKRVGMLSGGERQRLSLARLLLDEPNLLLLDEPTNHLDIESLEWLEQALVALDAAVVLVAHDRWFLEAVGTCVLEIEAGRTRFFKGPWHAWRKEQAAREIALGKAITKQQAEIERMEHFVERFRYKASKARQAQSRVKKLDKVERIERDPRDGRALGFQFKAPERSGRVIFELKDGRLEVPGRTLLHDAELWLERGEHVSLVGPNGTGKTTLIRAIAGQTPLAAGKLSTGHNVKLGYLSQHGEELEFGGARTVIEAAVKQTGLTPNESRALLGRFLFSGEEVDKPLDGLSGGERKRLGLAILVSSGSNVLVLDEPTNHLDLESREALEDALRSFTGSLLLVTHDRALLDAVGTRTVAVEDYTLRSYLGGWAEYARVREERLAAGVAPSAPPPPLGVAAGAASGERRADGMAADAGGRAARAESVGSAASVGGAKGSGAAKGLSKNRLKQQAGLEAAVEKAEAALATLEEELAGPEHWATKYESAKSTARHTGAKRAVEDAYAALEAFEATAVSGVSSA